LYVKNCTDDGNPQDLCSVIDFTSGRSSSGTGYIVLMTDLAGNFQSLTFYVGYQSGSLIFTSQPTKRSNSINLPTPPSQCLDRPDTCNSTISSMTLELYRNHGNGTFNRTLNNVNLADAIGEAYW
jgi:hypothetical protein